MKPSRIQHLHGTIEKTMTNDSSHFIEHQKFPTHIDKKKSNIQAQKYAITRSK